MSKKTFTYKTSILLDDKLEKFKVWLAMSEGKNISRFIRKAIKNTPEFKTFQKLEEEKKLEWLNDYVKKK